MNEGWAWPRVNWFVQGSSWTSHDNWERILIMQIVLVGKYCPFCNFVTGITPHYLSFVGCNSIKDFTDSPKSKLSLIRIRNWGWTVLIWHQHIEKLVENRDDSRDNKAFYSYWNMRAGVNFDRSNSWFVQFCEMQFCYLFTNVGRNAIIWLFLMHEDFLHLWNSCEKSGFIHLIDHFA